MLDWLTLIAAVPDHLQDAARAWKAGRWHVQKMCPATGEIEWSTPIRESVRSDTHQVMVHVGGRFEVSGSPARSMGYENNVFGSDDLRECAEAHHRLAQRALPFELPTLEDWRITRVDVTHNYAFGSDPEVRQALAYMGEWDGGRYRVQKRGNTSYWGLGSLLRSAKAYHKGPHLRSQIRKEQAWATIEQQKAADRLLRLEMKLGSHWWKRQRDSGKNQWDIDLQKEYIEYWSGLIGTVEVIDMNELEMMKRVAKTEGRARSAFRTWCVIKDIGHRAAKEGMSARTWYDHLKIFRDAGLSWADLSTGKVVPFRRRALILEQPVRSWAELGVEDVA